MQDERVRYPLMAISRNDRRDVLKEKLKSAEEIFVREMRARGFDPDQAENVALPTSLARLYAEREALQAELDEMKGEIE